MVFEAVPSPRISKVGVFEKVGEHRHLEGTSLFELFESYTFGLRLSLLSSPARTCPPHQDRFWWRRDFEAEDVTRMLVPGVWTILVVLLALWRKLGVVKGEVAARHHHVLRDALSHLLVGRPGKMHGNITRSRNLGGLDGSKNSFW